MPPTADEILHIRRLAIGQSTDTTTLPDADITALWDDPLAGDEEEYLTAAAACDMLAAAAARNFRWSADGQSIDKTMAVMQYRQTANRLRTRAAGGASGGRSTHVILRTVGGEAAVDVDDEDEFSA